MNDHETSGKTAAGKKNDSKFRFFFSFSVDVFNLLL